MPAVLNPARMDIPAAEIQRVVDRFLRSEASASMVVMEDGLPKRSDYRRFKVKTLTNQDDFASDHIVGYGTRPVAISK